MGQRPFRRRSGGHATRMGVRGRRGDRRSIMASVATTSAIPASRLHGQANRPSMVTVGTIVWLASELMFFAALFAAYFTIRGVSPELWELETALLNVPFATTNTTILVLSSGACQWGVFAAERGRVGRTGSIVQLGKWGMREWFVLTYLMGAIFVAGQAIEYVELMHEGVTIASSPYGSVFYLTTGFHGLHEIGRASCRERGKGQVGGRPRKRRGEEQRAMVG